MIPLSLMELSKEFGPAELLAMDDTSASWSARRFGRAPDGDHELYVRVTQAFTQDRLAYHPGRAQKQYPH
jgi:hypothetical protein